MSSSNSQPFTHAVINVDEVDAISMINGEGLGSGMGVGTTKTRSVAELDMKTNVGEGFGYKMII